MLITTTRAVIMLIQKVIQINIQRMELKNPGTFDNTNFSLRFINQNIIYFYPLDTSGKNIIYSVGYLF